MPCFVFASLPFLPPFGPGPTGGAKTGLDCIIYLLLILFYLNPKMASITLFVATSLPFCFKKILEIGIILRKLCSDIDNQVGLESPFCLFFETKMTVYYWT